MKDEDNVRMKRDWNYDRYIDSDKGSIKAWFMAKIEAYCDVLEESPEAYFNRKEEPQAKGESEG